MLKSVMQAKVLKSALPSTEEVTGIFVNSFTVMMKQTKASRQSGARRQLKEKGA